MVVEAFSPAFNLIKLIQEIYYLLTLEPNTPGSLSYIFHKTLSLLSTSRQHIYVLLSRIESSSLEVHQELLSVLSSHPNIHLVPTLDNPYLLHTGLQT